MTWSFDKMHQELAADEAAFRRKVETMVATVRQFLGGFREGRKSACT
jgi:hypothetical protein